MMCWSPYISWDPHKVGAYTWASTMPFTDGQCRILLRMTLRRLSWVISRHISCWRFSLLMLDNGIKHKALRASKSVDTFGNFDDTTSANICAHMKVCILFAHFQLPNFNCFMAELE